MKSWQMEWQTKRKTHAGHTLRWFAHDNRGPQCGRRFIHRLVEPISFELRFENRNNYAFDSSSMSKCCFKRWDVIASHRLRTDKRHAVQLTITNEWTSRCNIIVLACWIQKLSNDKLHLARSKNPIGFLFISWIMQQMRNEKKKKKTFYAKKNGKTLCKSYVMSSEECEMWYYLISVGGFLAIFLIMLYFVWLRLSSVRIASIISSINIAFNYLYRYDGTHNCWLCWCACISNVLKLWIDSIWSNRSPFEWS